MKVAKTGKSALGMVGIAAMVIIIIAAIAYILIQPGVLESLASILVIAIIVIVAAIVIVYLAMMIMAIPLYAIKGEQYQEGVDYSLKDVKPVKESSSDDKQNGSS